MAQGTSAFSFGSNKTPGFHLEYATVVSTRNEPQYRENKREEKSFSVTMRIKIYSEIQNIVQKDSMLLGLKSVQEAFQNMHPT